MKYLFLILFFCALSTTDTVALDNDVGINSTELSSQRTCQDLLSVDHMAFFKYNQTLSNQSKQEVKILNSVADAKKCNELIFSKAIQERCLMVGEIRKADLKLTASQTLNGLNNIMSMPDQKMKENNYFQNGV